MAGRKMPRISAGVSQDGWFVGKALTESQKNKYVQKDADYRKFSIALEDLFMDHLARNIDMVGDMEIALGPFAGNVNGATLFRIRLNTVLDVGLVNMNNVKGIRLGRLDKIFTVKGATEYINNVWAPSQLRKAKAAKGRRSCAEELQDALGDFTTMTKTQEDLSKLLRRMVHGWRHRSKFEYEYHFIMNDKDRELVEAFPDASPWELVGGGYSQKKGHAPIGYKMNILWVVVNKTRNMIQIGGYVGQNSTNYHGKPQITHQAKQQPWVAPKSMMKYLDKFVAQYPSIGALLADPNLKT